ncbi:MAG TPA: hypothetical protein VJ826_03445, partial [Candidatus Polarisedimenticolaceae bacterium]|nr:hypothetical protein [Candidatus Polarisedimenticolaceae bacterium]
SALADLRPRLAACDTPRGERSRDLTIGPWRLRFDGLDAGLDGYLQDRWAAFWGPPEGIATVTVHVRRGDGNTWIPPGPPGERYRLEAAMDAQGIFVASYRFALAPEASSAWKLAIEETPTEPIDRIVDNATRYVVARLAVEQGGLALHGAGIARRGRAWIFAGPSRSGKSTAISNSQGVSLGDDFAVALPGKSSWTVPAVPFDNAESGSIQTSTAMPLAKILRLRHAPTPRLERPPAPLAQAALIGCAAFPWALPDLTTRIDDAVAALVSEGLFAELWLAPDASFWDVLDAE